MRIPRNAVLIAINLPSLHPRDLRTNLFYSEQHTLYGLRTDDKSVLLWLRYLQAGEDAAAGAGEDRLRNHDTPVLLADRFSTCSQRFWQVQAAMLLQA
jgi:hypothetical protein